MAPDPRGSGAILVSRRCARQLPGRRLPTVRAEPLDPDDEHIDRELHLEVLVATVRSGSTRLGVRRDREDRGVVGRVGGAAASAGSAGVRGAASVVVGEQLGAAGLARMDP